ncbi:nuclear transport factor 2 family protein [Flavobacterium sp. LS1R49]|uniref:Nuclear transport factor 2 family protein n=1 Tax=Flavobacterium shii TaxID=2987687 RepID=A0A9X2YWV4_9FLAO|nr:nuclear transport factor 2 family protein [Flavobacterium shii]MCV9929539.1 nuclear transport factor 2 family protein [Flavobacterium shii]
MEETNLTIRISAIEDKMAIREVFDTFSILADERNLQTQALLFTENAIVESYFNGQLALAYNGRKEISEGFSDFVKNFETLYHINGQQIVKLNGNKANSIAYCHVTLVGDENGKKMKTNLGVIYHDEFERLDKKWLISKRKSFFTWQEKVDLGQPLI